MSGMDKSRDATGGSYETAGTVEGRPLFGRSDHLDAWTERRIDSRVRLWQWAAMLCAAFASVGIAVGVHDMSGEGATWWIPVIAGIVSAIGFALFWHVVIGAVVGMVRGLTIALLFVGALIMTAVALGASAQAIATVFAGKAAVSAELGLRIDEYQKSLDAAYGQIGGRLREVADATGTMAAGLRAQGGTEAAGGHGTGAGCGPLCGAYLDAANSFENGWKALEGMVADADSTRDRGQAGVNAMRLAAANGDQQAFMAGASEVSAAVAELGAVNPQSIIDNTGVVIGTVKTDGKGTVKGGSIALGPETEKYRQSAAAAMAGREQVTSPVFLPVSKQEAVRRQVFGAALHGWILAGAIDVLPLIFMTLIFVLSREVWLNERVAKKGYTWEGRNERDRLRIANLHATGQEHGTDRASEHGSSVSVVHFPGAAE